MSDDKKQVKKKDERVRNFASVVYPESAVENWIDILNDLHVAAFISPLHDKDIDPDGNVKKPHYHIMLMFEGKKDFENQVKPIFDTIGAVGREYIQSLRGYARYLCHLDNPEKHQYNVGDVISLAGADYLECIGLPDDVHKCICEMEAWAIENKCIYYSELSTFARMYKPEWHRVLIHNSIHISYFLRSLEYKIGNEITEAEIRR